MISHPRERQLKQVDQVSTRVGEGKYISELALRLVELPVLSKRATSAMMRIIYKTLKEKRAVIVDTSARLKN